MSEHKFDPVEESKEISSPKMGWGRYLDLLMKDGFLFSNALLCVELDNKYNAGWFRELPDSVQAKLIPALNNVLLGLYDYLVMHSTSEKLITAIGNLLHLAQLDSEFINISGLTETIEKFIQKVVTPYLFGDKKIKIARCKECGCLFAQKRVSEVFCCDSCNNKYKGRVYREKHPRVKRKEHEHDQNRQGIIPNN